MPRNFKLDTDEVATVLEDVDIKDELTKALAPIITKAMNEVSAQIKADISNEDGLKNRLGVALYLDGGDTFRWFDISELLKEEAERVSDYVGSPEEGGNRELDMFKTLKSELDEIISSLENAAGINLSRHHVRNQR